MLLALLGLSGCGDDPVGEPAAGRPDTIQVSSEAIEPGGVIPVRFTCDGVEVSPPLSWSGIPDGSASLALVVDDPDAPGGTFVHWVLVDIPVDVGSVSQGQVPLGAVQGKNSSGGSSYFGPCPPSGTHHYRFTVFALSAPTGLQDGAGLDDALHAIDTTAVARGRLTATYRRRPR